MIHAKFLQALQKMQTLLSFLYNQGLCVHLPRQDIRELNSEIFKNRHNFNFSTMYTNRNNCLTDLSKIDDELFVLL